MLSSTSRATVFALSLRASPLAQPSRNSVRRAFAAADGLQTDAGASRRLLRTSAPAFVAQPSPPSPSAPESSKPDGPKASPPPAGRNYSPLTVSVVRGMALLMGYKSRTSTAIRVTSDLYDRCAERAEMEAQFFYKECGLPESYQTWFQITNLHVWLLLVRFRSMPKPLARVYTQELVNHFFLDAEHRMRQKFGVTTSRLVKGYMNEMFEQHRGAVVALDEGLAAGDAVLATALWRNLWGAGWGTVGGVKSKAKGVDSGDGVGEAEVTTEDSRAGEEAAEAASLGPQVDPSLPPEFAFPIILSRLVEFLRKETYRLQALSDDDVKMGRQPTPAGDMNLASFGKV